MPTNMGSALPDLPLEAETRNPEPEIRSPRTETRNPKHDILIPNPEPLYQAYKLQAVAFNRDVNQVCLDYFTEMCSSSEVGSYLRLIDYLHA